MHRSALIGILALSACSSAGAPQRNTLTPPAETICTTVASVKLNADYCAGRSVQLKANLVAEHHRNWIVDPDGGGVLRATFPASKESISPLALELIQARLGHSDGRLSGIFEGMLMIDPGNNSHVFVVHRRIQ